MPKIHIKYYYQKVALSLLASLSTSISANTEIDAPLLTAASDNYLDYSLEQLMSLEISSATKRPETIEDIPASVTIITRRDLERMGYATVEEVLRNVPGLYLIDDYEDMLIGVRGGIGGGIQFPLNGVDLHPTRVKGLTVQDRSRFNIPVQAIDRIEVVRGPMSVIYGNNAFLGSVNIVTNQVQSTPNLASASYGNNQARQAFLRLRNESDEGFVVFNAGFETNDGVEGRYSEFMDSEQLSTLDPDMHQALDGDMDHENISLNLSANYRDTHLDLQYSRMDYGYYIFTPPFNDGSRQELDNFHASLSHQRAMKDDLRLSTHLIYSQEKNDIRFDAIVPDNGGTQAQNSERLDVEAKMDWSPSEQFNLMAGYQHHRLFDIENRPQIPVLNVDGMQASTDVSRNDLFVEADYRPIDTLKLLVGSRWSRTESFRVTRNDQFSGSQQWDFPASSHWTPRAGMIWTVDEHNVVKLLYGEALQDNQQVEITEPEEISTWELNWLNRIDRSTLSVSLFQNRIDHLLRKAQFFNNSTGQYEKRQDNSGRLQTRGIELIARWQPLQALDWSLSATWQETEDLEHPDKAPGYSPSWLLKSQLSYRRSSWSGGLSVSYVDTMEADWQWVTAAEPGVWERLGDKVDDYWLVDANLRYDFPRRGPYVNLHISNLLDEDVLYPATELLDFRYGAPGPGRLILLTLGLKF